MFTTENPLVRAGEVATAISRRASDHYGVVADLGVPQHPPGT